MGPPSVFQAPVRIPLLSMPFSSWHVPLLRTAEKRQPHGGWVPGPGTGKMAAWWLRVTYPPWYLTLRTNRTVVFQPSIFRCKVAVIFREGNGEPRDFISKVGWFDQRTEAWYQPMVKWYPVILGGKPWYQVSRTTIFCEVHIIYQWLETYCSRHIPMWSSPSNWRLDTKPSTSNQKPLVEDRQIVIYRRWKKSCTSGYG